MSDRATTFDEPKKYLDDEECFDVIDDIRRYIDKLKKTNMELEEGNQHWILLDEINRKEIKRLKDIVQNYQNRLYETGAFLATT